MRTKQEGFSLIELLIVVTIILIIVAIAIPNLVGTKMSANEVAAIGALRALDNAALMYSNQCGGYPPSLAAMGPPANGCTAADLIDSVLASGNKSGYVFTYNAVDTNGDGKMDSYTIIAEPASRGSTGRRGFFTDQSGVIRSNPNGTADINSTPIG